MRVGPGTRVWSGRAGWLRWIRRFLLRAGRRRRRPASFGRRWRRRPGPLGLDDGGSGLAPVGWVARAGWAVETPCWPALPGLGGAAASPGLGGAAVPPGGWAARRFLPPRPPWLCGGAPPLGRRLGSGMPHPVLMWPDLFFPILSRPDLASSSSTCLQGLQSSLWWRPEACAGVPSFGVRQGRRGGAHVFAGLSPLHECCGSGGGALVSVGRVCCRSGVSSG